MTKPYKRFSAALMLVLAAAVWLQPALNAAERKFNPGHYIAMNMWDGRDAIPDALRPGVAGVQVRYTWRDLEPAKDSYDFSAIEADLAVLKAANRQLVVFVFDKSFKDERYTPAYLWEDHTLPSNESSGGVGYVAKRWDPYVVERMSKLLEALGRAFDSHPNFEGVALQESAIGVKGSVLSDAGYTPLKYRDALIELLQNGADALPHSRVFWYMNFLSGGQRYVADVAAAVAPHGVAIGGPDILPGHKPLEKHVYPVLRSLPDAVTFNSAQYNSFRWKHRGAPGYWSPMEIFEFAQNELALSYIFWNRTPQPNPKDSFAIEDAYPVIAAHPRFEPAAARDTDAAGDAAKSGR